MKQFYIIPFGLPRFNSFSIEVAQEAFEKLCVEMISSNLHVTTEIETFQETNIERWYLDYMENGKQSETRLFEYTLTPIESNL